MKKEDINKDTTKKSVKKKTDTSKKTTTKKEVTKKKNTAKSVKKNNKVKKEDVKEPVIKNEVITIDEVLEPKKETNKFVEFFNKYKKALIIVVAALLVIIIVSSIVKGSSYKTYKLSDIYPTFEGSEEKIKLPKDWLSTNDGEFYKLEDGLLHMTGNFLAMPASEDDYLQTIDAITQYYEIENININDTETIKFNENYQDNIYTYYLMFKNDKIYQLTFMNIDDNVQLDVVNSLK